MYKGWLTSESLVKRSFAVMGHLIVAYGIILGGIVLLGIVVGIGEALFK